MNPTSYRHKQALRLVMEAESESRQNIDTMAARSCTKTSFLPFGITQTFSLLCFTVKPVKNL